MLKLDHVTKVFTSGTFGGAAVTAVSDVTLEIKPGEVVSLIGESGSGKTTVGRMILRLTEVTDGTITFEGNDVTALGGRRLRGYYKHVQGVFQDLERQAHEAGEGFSPVDEQTARPPHRLS